MNPPFERTTCACKRCVACCKRQPAMLVPGDYERISQFIGKPADEFLWASKGAKVLMRSGELLQIGTITPKFLNGRCVFLDWRNRCTIHPVAPFGCAYADMHMDRREGDRRVGWALKQIMDSPEYTVLRNRLPECTHYAPRGAL